MEEILESTYPAVAGGGDAASFVLSRLPHPDTTASAAAAFVDAAGAGGERTTLSFVALRRAALSLASGLRFGLGLRRGDAVLVLSPNSLLLPPIVLGVLAAGGVVIAADPGSTAEEVAAVARSSGAVIVVAAPEVAEKVAGAGVPLLLTSRSMDPRALSAEELMDDGDPTALASPEEAAAAMPRPSDVAFVFYSSATTKTAATMTHADLIAAVASASSSPDEGRVCLASLPICSVHGLPLLALALPAAGVTTVLLASPSSDPTVARVAAAAHGATDVVATPDVAAALAAPVALQGKMLAALRRVTVVPALATTEARQAFRRWLPWVELTEMSGSPEKRMASVSEQVQVMPDAARAAVMEQNSGKADSTSVTSEVASSVPLLKKIQKTVLGDILSKSTANKILREHPEIISKL